MIGAVVVVVILAGAVIAFVLTRGDDEVNLTRSELQSALLTPEEVGPDFEETELDSDDDDSGFQPTPECQDVIDRINRTDDEGDEVAIEVTREDPGLELTHSIEPLEESDPDLDELRALIERCPSIPYDDGATTGDFRLTPEDVSDVGEEALALQIQFAVEEPEPDTFEAYVIYFFRDGIVESLTAFPGVDEEDNALPVDADLVRQTAIKADEKLQRVIDES